ncbi:MAG TPA: arabinan endo-1,5-alpha-L-arabinosidase [Prolixibacteraceae bacterium]|nr:arabinan endo-1,5-alpha-L-arabinosidase [Prolixibacteraceae bacterium]
MTRFITVWFLAFLLSIVGCRAQKKTIVVHDPVAIEADGGYYMYSTGVGIASWHSDDLENWQFLAQVFNPVPEWAKKEVPLFDRNIWAPDISFHNGRYYLYYSISSFASNRSCIGVATNTALDPADPAYRWEDHGKVIESVPGRDNWNAIDPNLVIDTNGTPWLAFGSFWGGLKLVKLDSSLQHIAVPQEWYTLAARPRNPHLEEKDPGDGAIEAPFIIFREGFYYLFASFDLCCRGENSTYNVRVGRSKNITGPYFDQEGVSMLDGGGTLLVGPNENYYGMGHSSVYHFMGNDYFFCHAYDKNDKGRPKLISKILEWDSEGWPSIH